MSNFPEYETAAEGQLTAERPEATTGLMGRVPLSRITERLDALFAKKDTAGAERHLKYWLGEARALGDRGGELVIRNEMVGFYRKQGRRDDAYEAAASAVRLAGSAYSGGTEHGTALVNAATARQAFGDTAEAVSLFSSAREIYEKNLKSDDPRLGGLYNNFALARLALKDYAGARELFELALGVMSRNEGGEPSMAVTWCNLADLAAAEKGLEDSADDVKECLGKARELLDAEGKRDGAYAFVCEKCAPVFGYYGYFIDERVLNERAGSIYARA
ncbi:MAG: tetratricopeptide repeat protein [Clostridia bacterium]|nr:tetratricopeptide repeat protein [Clostridia bacterium]